MSNSERREEILKNLHVAKHRINTAAELMEEQRDQEADKITREYAAKLRPHDGSNRYGKAYQETPTPDFKLADNPYSRRVLQAEKEALAVELGKLKSHHESETQRLKCELTKANADKDRLERLNAKLYADNVSFQAQLSKTNPQADMANARADENLREVRRLENHVTRIELERGELQERLSKLENRAKEPLASVGLPNDSLLLKLLVGDAHNGRREAEHALFEADSRYKNLRARNARLRVQRGELANYVRALCPVLVELVRIFQKHRETVWGAQIHPATADLLAQYDLLNKTWDGFHDLAGQGTRHALRLIDEEREDAELDKREADALVKEQAEKKARQEALVPPIIPAATD